MLSTALNMGERLQHVFSDLKTGFVDESHQAIILGNPEECNMPILLMRINQVCQSSI